MSHRPLTNTSSLKITAAYYTILIFLGFPDPLSASGFVRQMYGSQDPDPHLGSYKNVTASKGGKDIKNKMEPFILGEGLLSRSLRGRSGLQRQRNYLINLLNIINFMPEHFTRDSEMHAAHQRLFI